MRGEYMDNIFSHQRGKYLFQEGQTDPFFIGERSKSVEHPTIERSKNIFLSEFENSQKTEENEENQS